MNILNKLLLVTGLTILLIPSLALAGEAEEVKAGHKAAAQAYFATLEPGVKLTGTVKRNDSVGQFEAFYYDGSWLVKQIFGGLESVGYSDPESSWSMNNYTLPYLVEAEDSPINQAMEILSDRRYLEEPYWEHFEFIDEDAGGFNFEFTYPGLPKVKVVLYSDGDEPWYLQVMSLEARMSEFDDNCISYRSFYYYRVDENGVLIKDKETGRELDDSGQTVNFVEYIVDDPIKLTEEPEELLDEFSRKPFSKSAASLDESVLLDVRTDAGYFMLPLNFEGSDETFWFVFDTGATSSLFSPAAAKAAGIEEVITLPTHGHGSSVEFALGMCNSASIGMANEDAQAPLDPFLATTIPQESDLLQIFLQYNADGLLGVSPLHQYIATFDHTRGQVEFIPPHLFDPSSVTNDHTYEMDLDVEDLIYGQARLNEELEGEIVIDSGLQQDIALLQETIDHEGIELNKIDVQDSAVVGGVRSFDMVMVPVFELIASKVPEGHRPLLMSNSIASMTEDNHGSLSARKIIGFVGITLFLDVKVTLDLFNQKMYYEVPADMVLTDENENEDEESNDLPSIHESVKV